MDKKTVLIVDDDPTVRKIVTKQVEKIGARSVVASDGERAYRMIEDGNSFDLIITDYVMPRVNGADLVNLLHQKVKDFEVPIIMISGVVRVSEINKTLENGVRYFMPKPLDVGALQQYLMNCLFEEDEQ